MTVAGTDRRSGPGRDLSLWLLAAAGSGLAVWVARLSDNSIGTIPAVWAVGAANVLWASIAWMGRSTPRPLVLLATALSSMAVFVAVSRLYGADSDLLRLALGNVVQAAVTIALYKAYLRAPRFAPIRPTELLVLFVASLAGAAAALPVGATEHVDLGSGIHPMLWWVLHSGTGTFVGVASISLLFSRSPGTERVLARARDAYGQLILAGLAIWAIGAWPGLPVTWLILLPALWAGMTLGMWAASAFCTTMVLTGMLISAAPIRLGGTVSDPVPSRIVLDLMMATFVAVVLVLAMVRDRNVHLLAAVTRAQQKASEQSGLLTVLFESMGEGMVLINDRHEVEILNRAAQRFPIDELLASAPAEMLAGDDQPHIVELPPGHDRHGPVRTVLAHSAPLRYGGAQMVALILRDITAERQYIHDLASFAGVAAHDLKSPLVAIQGWLEVAEEAVDNEPDVARTAMLRGRSATNRMAHEIDAWLSYSLASEGELHPEVVHIDDLLADVAGTYPSADVMISTHNAVHSDPVLTRQLLFNLVGNAVKYTAEGQHPEITIQTRPDTEKGWVRVEVTDRGIGIPAGEEQSVFDPFYRAVHPRQYDGAGLGLALCKRIVQRHGGEISAHPNAGTTHGTTITFTLPAGDQSQRLPVPQTA